MKIPSINFYPQHNSISGLKINTSSKKNYYSAQLNFEGRYTKEQIKKFPLEKKLKFLFNSAEIWDLIAVGNSIEVVQKGLANNVERFSEIIKRVLFIKDKDITQPLVFSLLDPYGWGCTNIGDKNILLSTSCNTLDFEPNKWQHLTDGDIIVNDHENIPIVFDLDYSKYGEDSNDYSLLTDPESFATQTFKFYKARKAKIKNANYELIELLLEQDLLESNKNKKIGFKDIGGLDTTIDNLKKSILYPIQYPFAYNNVDINRGILLYGKPGTGKTLLGEALANEAHARIFKISGTDFESKWVGDTEAKWRDLFRDAIKNQPSIIFIDEFDAVVKERGKSEGNSHSDKTVNQILSLMSDLEKSNNQVFVIATTNKPETIDSAMLRSGRFGKQIEVTTPDEEGLLAIFNIHTRGKKLDADLDKAKLIKEFKQRGFTGADVKHIVNEAHTNSWVRTDIYKKMQDGTLTPKDMIDINITSEDLYTALIDWDKNQKAKVRQPLGYKQ